MPVLDGTGGSAGRLARFLRRPENSIKVKDLARVDTRARICGRLDGEPDGPWPSPVRPSPVSPNATRTRCSNCAQQDEAVDAVDQDLARFERLLEESDDLLRLINSPVFSADDQVRAVSAVADRAEIVGLVGNFLRVAARNRRLFAVPGHDQGVPADCRRGARRGGCRGDQRRMRSRQTRRPSSRQPSRASPARTWRSTSPSIRRCSAAWSSRSARVRSTLRSEPNSHRSSSQ